MFRREVNERSPMRVFEGSMHGGLGPGNVGIVASPPGVGKTALLVQIALDDLLRDRKVLHISREHAVDHVRSYYDEIFHDISQTSRLEGPEAILLDIERDRLILSLLGQVRRGAPSEGGIVQKIQEMVLFARDIAHFEPDVIVIDGFDASTSTPEAVKALADLARERSAELWFSVQTPAGADVGASLPAPIAAIVNDVAVVVCLQPERDVVRLRLLKDHANTNLKDLHLRLDPHSMRVIDEDVRPPSERPRDPRKFRLISGGAKGAEAEFGACAERWELHETNYSFEGHKLLERERGVVTLSEDELRKGDFSLMYVSRRLGRVLSEIPLVRNVLQTIWHQLNAASQVFVVGIIQEDGTVRGGTGWGAELARLWKKPLYVYDQQRRGWFRWSGKAWEMDLAPTISHESFAGIGTQDLSDEGREAIRDLFLRSFGAPAS
ncbi:AAA family ATPase [Chondromyces crocatus]|uniref:Uncharacterized protein n=1 Tax=Chondromyces crocatus TaxID=52 RepID=A0A0K1EBZ3_CHOCO|nr:AAA family ATPase [Chondromyces crocatus]AKT38078.1 uncharacterized protein CMC5_022200 [Chondromyces crocatus]